MFLADGFHLFKTSLSDLFFPPTCAFCEAEIVESDAIFCDACNDSVDWVNEPICRQCGLPVPGLAVEGSGHCGRCLATPPPYRRARYAAYYHGTFRDALLRFKFAGALHVAAALSQILAEAFRKYFQPSDFDLIVPVPIHRSRLIHRGFNQVVVLAQELSRETGILLDRTSFKKIKDTPPQVGLPRSDRVKNLRGSFGLKRRDRIRGRKVLLLDDVATTGSTISEAAKTIMRGGATRVDALVLALRMDGAPQNGTQRSADRSEPPITDKVPSEGIDRR